MAKRCNRCKEVKPLEQFYKSGNGVQSWCSQCCREYQREYYLEDPRRAIERSKNWRIKYKDKFSAYRKANRGEAYLYELKKKYGIDREVALALIKKSKGRCAVCKTIFLKFGKSRRNLDHCHKTGIPRGFICTRCNSILGLSEDNYGLLRKLSNYLRKSFKLHSAGTSVLSTKS